jgi:hypothetical protein
MLGPFVLRMVIAPLPMTILGPHFGVHCMQNLVGKLAVESNEGLIGWGSFYSLP